jgi:hypothetical protein
MGMAGGTPWGSAPAQRAAGDDEARDERRGVLVRLVRIAGWLR